MNPEERQVDPDEPGIDIGPEKLDQVSQGFVNKDDEQDGREIIEEGSELS